MKSLKFISLLMMCVMFFVIYLPVGAADTTDFFVTEVCYNPPDSDSYEDLYEYIEVVNISDRAIDIRDGSVTYQADGGEVKSNALYTAATEPVQPGQIVVIVIYQSSTATKGVEYRTADKINSMREDFNADFNSDVTVESFYVAPQVSIEDVADIEGAFCLTNDAEESVVSLKDAEGSVLCAAAYNAVKYDRDKYSVGFGLSKTQGPRCMGITAMTPGNAYEELYTPIERNFTENLKVMTYNICATGVKSDYPGNLEGLECVPSSSLYIDQRYDEVLGVVLEESPDILCLNEMNGEWWHYVESMLCREDEKYGYTGLSSNTGSAATELTDDKWDTIPILLYDKAKYKMVDEGSFACPEDERGLSTVNNWATLRSKSTGAKFVVMTQHLAAGSTDVRTKVREDSAELIISKVKEIAGDLPVMILGDYNCSEGSNPYSTFVNNGFNDSSRMNSDITFRGTYSGWYLNEDLTPKKDLNIYLPIDLIMLSEDDFTVESYAVLEDMYEDTNYGYSDHYPVVVELTMRSVSEGPIIPVTAIAVAAVTVAAVAVVVICVVVKSKKK